MTDRSDREPLSSEDLIRMAREELRSSELEEAAPTDPPGIDAPETPDEPLDFDTSVITEPKGFADPDRSDVPAEEPEEIDDREKADFRDEGEEPEWRTPEPVDAPVDLPPPPPAESFDPDAWAEVRNRSRSTWDTRDEAPTWTEQEPWTPDPTVPGGRVPRPETGPSGWSRFWSVGRWVVGGIFLVSIFGQCFGSGTTLDSLSIGDCFEDPGIGVEVSEVETLDCNQLHDFELYAVVDLGDSDRIWPGSDLLFNEVEDECIDRFPGYVGRDYLTSAYDFVSFTPVKDGWEAGDRTGMCAIYEFDDNFNLVRAIGTARNSGR